MSASSSSAIFLSFPVVLVLSHVIFFLEFRCRWISLKLVLYFSAVNTCRLGGFPLICCTDAWITLSDFLEGTKTQVPSRTLRQICRLRCLVSTFCCSELVASQRKASQSPRIPKSSKICVLHQEKVGSAYQSALAGCIR